MSRQKHSGEEIINKLREVDVSGRGMSMEEVMHQQGVSDATYYHEVMASPQVAEGI